MEPVRERLTTALRAAMKVRAHTRVSVLRSTLAAIENAEAVEDDGRPVVQDAPHALLGDDLGDRHAAGQLRIAGSVGGLGAGEVPRAVIDEQASRAIVVREADERRVAPDE